MFGLEYLLCWVPRRRHREPRPPGEGQGEKRRRRRHMRRHIHAKAGLASVRVPTGGDTGSQGLSPASDARLSHAFSDEFHDAVEWHEFESMSGRSSVDGSVVGSPAPSLGRGDGAAALAPAATPPPTVMARLAGWWEARQARQAAAATEPTTPCTSPGSPPRAASLGSPPTPELPPEELIEPEGDARVGCMSLFAVSSAALAHKKFLRLAKPPAGSSFRQKLDDEAEAGVAAAWEAADGTAFSVRSQGYMRSKLKQPSGPCLYRLLGVDVYSFDFKLFHIAQHVQLPDAPALGAAAAELPPDQRLPPLLIINLQLPIYSPSLFGTNDGPGHSLVYYFALPEGWEPSQVSNAAALALVQRFVHNRRELDGTPTRDRLKLIPRIVNVGEWAEKGPLSSYEHRLLLNYNDKPLLTRPQHRFYTGPGYLEIDLDVHSYAFVARKAFHGYISRLAPVIFENAFVVQGNRPEELPEQVLAAARVYRLDFTRARPFPAKSVDQLGNGTGPAHDGEAARR